MVQCSIAFRVGNVDGRTVLNQRAGAVGVANHARKHQWRDNGYVLDTSAVRFCTVLEQESDALRETLDDSADNRSGGGTVTYEYIVRVCASLQ